MKNKRTVSIIQWVGHASSVSPALVEMLLEERLLTAYQVGILEL